MNFRKYAGIILNILVPLLTVYLVCVWGLRLVVFFLPFVIGWIVAAIANPVVRFFEKRLKIVRRHGSMVLIAGVLALVIFGIYALFSWVFREMTEFGQALPGIYASIREEVDLACERIGGLLKYLPADTETTDHFRAGECGWIYRRFCSEDCSFRRQPRSADAAGGLCEYDYCISFFLSVSGRS